MIEAHLSGIDVSSGKSSRAEKDKQVSIKKRTMSEIKSSTLSTLLCNVVQNENIKK